MTQTSRCPVCDGELDADRVGLQPTSRCESCGGTWLSAGRFDALAGRDVEVVISKSTRAAAQCRRCGGALKPGEPTCDWCARPNVIGCPDGHGTLETAAVTIGTSSVELDRCATCGGIWFDAHERGHLEELGEAAVEVQRLLKSAPVHTDVVIEEDEPARAWWLKYAIILLAVFGLIVSEHFKREDRKAQLRELWADRCIAANDRCEAIVGRGSDSCFEHNVPWFYRLTEEMRDFGPWADARYTNCMMQNAPQKVGINWINKQTIGEILYP